MSSSSSMSDVSDDFTARISEELGALIRSRSATYACGGTIPITSTEGNDTQSTAAVPVILRWDNTSNASEAVAKLTFPVNTSAEDENSNLHRLLASCQPASFGRNGEHVLDDSYRKAFVLDRSAFSIDFCPYEHGIIDSIAQVLLPNAEAKVLTHGVKAELYKLNIYAAPSGFFKPHVDTPRSKDQFGSLVVSLPCYHKGGQLGVRHAGHSTTFDLGSSTTTKDSNATIQWAAFYSDCEHEVLEVTEGYRITLTYNLYYVAGLGDLADKTSAMDAKTLPLYKNVKEALATINFMPDGGHLGIHLRHAYAHSTKHGAQALPSVLKGIDMAVYSVFRSLGLDTELRTTMVGGADDDPYEASDDSSASKDRIYVKDNFSFVNSRYDEVESSRFRDIAYLWGGKEARNVRWLSWPSASNANVGYAYLINGNEPSVGTTYTFVALLIRVPPSNERFIQGEH